MTYSETSLKQIAARINAQRGANGTWPAPRARDVHERWVGRIHFHFYSAKPGVESRSRKTRAFIDETPYVVIRAKMRRPGDGKPMEFSFHPDEMETLVPWFETVTPEEWVKRERCPVRVDGFAGNKYAWSLKGWEVQEAWNAVRDPEHQYREPF
jgi:hypothetical protein